MTKAADRRFVTEAAQTTALATKVNSSTYTSGLAGKQDAGDYATNTGLSNGLAGKQDLSTVAATVSASGALVVSKHNPVNATSGALTMTLPTGAASGTLLSVEKTDATANAVTITGSIRGVGSTTISLVWQNESLLLRADAAGSWWPVSGHKTKTSLDGVYQQIARLHLASPYARAMAAQTAFSVAPTFTEVGSTTSTLTSPRSYSATATTPPFRYNLNDTLVNAGSVNPYGPTTTVARVADQAQSMQVEFDFDGQAFELDSNYSANSRFRVWANEQQTTTFTPTSFGRKYIKVDFGSRAYRRITIEFDNVSIFLGLIVAGTDVVNPPSSRSPLKFAGVGDSYMWGTGYIPGSLPTTRSYFLTMARLLGFVNIRKYAVSGTGFVNTPGGGAQTYINRIGDVLSFQPDVVLVQGSINDNGQTALQIQTAAETYLTALKAGLPTSSRILLTSPLRALAAIAGDVTQTTGLAAAAATFGIPFIDATNTTWFTGSGTIAAPNGTGNADFYQTNSPVTHPSPAGHEYLGQQMAREVAKALGISL